MLVMRMGLGRGGGLSMGGRGVVLSISVIISGVSGEGSGFVSRQGSSAK